MHCRQELEVPPRDTGEDRHVGLDRAVAGGITNSGEADNRLTNRRLATEGCSFPRHVIDGVELALRTKKCIVVAFGWIWMEISAQIAK